MLWVEETTALPVRLPLFLSSWGTSHHSVAVAAADVVVEQLVAPEDAKKQ